MTEERRNWFFQKFSAPTALALIDLTEYALQGILVADKESDADKALLEGMIDGYVFTVGKHLAVESVEQNYADVDWKVVNAALGYVRSEWGLYQPLKDDLTCEDIDIDQLCEDIFAWYVEISD